VIYVENTLPENHSKFLGRDTSRFTHFVFLKECNIMKRWRTVYAGIVI
jgi:hypothetical protein